MENPNGSSAPPTRPMQDPMESNFLTSPLLDELSVLRNQAQGSMFLQNPPSSSSNLINNRVPQVGSPVFMQERELRNLQHYRVPERSARVLEGYHHHHGVEINTRYSAQVTGLPQSLNISDPSRFAWNRRVLDETIKDRHFAPDFEPGMKRTTQDLEGLHLGETGIKRYHAQVTGLPESLNDLNLSDRHKGFLPASQNRGESEQRRRILDPAKERALEQELSKFGIFSGDSPERDNVTRGQVAPLNSHSFSSGNHPNLIPYTGNHGLWRGQYAFTGNHVGGVGMQINTSMGNNVPRWDHGFPSTLPLVPSSVPSFPQNKQAVFYPHNAVQHPFHKNLSTGSRYHNAEGGLMNRRVDSQADQVRELLLTRPMDLIVLDRLKVFLDEGNLMIRGIILEWVLSSICEIATNRFGYVLFCELLDVCDYNQKEAIVSTVTCDAMILPFGPLLITYCLQHLQPELNKFILQYASRNFDILAMDRIGWRSLEKCIDLSSELQRKAIVKKTIGSCVGLAKHCFGNRIVQSVIKIPDRGITESIWCKLKQQFFVLSMNQYGNYVIKSCIGSAVGKQVLGELVNCKTEQLQQMANDPYGSEVLQMALNVLKDEQLYNKLVQVSTMLKDNPNGIKILRLVGEFQSKGHDLPSTR